MCGVRKTQRAFGNIHKSHLHWFLENDDEGVIRHLNPATDRMLTRIKDVYLYILENGIVTTENLVEEFGITHRTVQRDLNVLEYNDLITSPVRGKWTTTEKKVKFSSRPAQ